MFLPLASGSSGNSALITSKGTKILIDCGISGKRLEEAMNRIDMSCRDLDAILVTHEHTDHISGVGIISRRYSLPIYATEKTHKCMNVGRIAEENIKIINAGEAFEIGDIAVSAYHIQHDAADPVGFSFTADKEKYAITTDTGIMTEEIKKSIFKSRAVILEANHDVDMLMYGDYPFQLKQRILGKRGHLSNDSAAEAIIELLENGTESIMLAHLSHENNTPELAYKTAENALTEHGALPGRDLLLKVAARNEVTPFI